MANSGGSADKNSTTGPSLDDNSSGLVPLESEVRRARGDDQMPGGNFSYYPREGGIRGGGVSETETLPRLYPMGMDLSGQIGTNGMPSVGSGYSPGANPVYGSRGVDGSPVHGMDAGHAQSQVPAGQMVHGAGGPAVGGWHKCGAHGCSYKSRSKHGLARHAGVHNKRHGLEGTGATPSSPATPSSTATPSSSATGSSGAISTGGEHGFTNGRPWLQNQGPNPSRY